MPYHVALLGPEDIIETIPGTVALTCDSEQGSCTPPSFEEESQPDSEQTDGEQTDGEQTDGEQTDGDQTDGEQTDGEEPESAYTLATYAALGASTLLF